MIPFPNGPFSAILADPPWPYDSPRAIVGNGGRGAAGADKIIQADVQQHYQTMTLADIKALPVGALLEPSGGFLFLWTTNPFLADGSASEVVRSWGFIPKSVLTWAKVQTDGRTPSMKTGHWFRSASEHLIFATKGKVKRNHGFPALPTWFSGPRLPHSVKPETAHRLVETVAPTGQLLELFARRIPASPRWEAWGDQVPIGED